MRRLPLFASLPLALAVIAAACGGGSGGTATATLSQIQPLPGNSELVVGPNRFAIGFVDANNERILESGNSVHLQFFDPDNRLTNEQDAKFIWGIPNVSGFWVANVSFDRAGAWYAIALVKTSSQQQSLRVGFPVSEHGNAPSIGDAAIPADNLTLAQDSNMKRLSTDPQPDPSFYQLTVRQAIDAHKPFVVIFATPLFCTSQMCGPMLTNVKAIASGFSGRVNFIHIEPYDLTENGELVTDSQNLPVAATPTNQWHLQTEPWVFVVGTNGKIAARFEANASTEELTAAVQQVAGS